LQQPSSVSTPAPAPGFTIIDSSRPKLSLDKVQPAEVPAAVEATYRLTPDRRVLMAVADIYEFSTGIEAPTINVDFAGGKWHIRCAGMEVGTLAELATFHDELDFLTQWSARLRSQRSTAPPMPQAILASVDRDIDAFAPPNLFAAIDRIAKYTSGQSLDGLSAARAAHATTLLSSQVNDWFAFSDPLLSRALALVAIAKQIDARNCADDETMIADLLGYSKEGASRPSALPAPARRDWLTKRETLQRATLSDPQNLFRGAIDVQFSPLLLDVSEFSTEAPIGAAVTGLILREVESNRFNRGEMTFTGNSDWSNAYPQLAAEAKVPLQRFEQGLPKRVAALQNSLLNAESVASYYQSNFYAALEKQFAFHAFQRADREGSRNFIASLGKPSTNAGTQVTTWMSAYCDAKFEAAHGIKRPDEVLKSTALLGIRRRFELLESLGTAIGNYDLVVRRAATDLYQTLDSRPSEMYAAGQISMQFICDPQRRDRYTAAAVERMTHLPHWGDAVSYLASTGDRAALRDIVEHSRNDSDRTAALAYLSELGEDAAYVHRKFEEIGLNTESMSALSGYARYLNARGEAAIKERFMRRWLEKWEDRGDSLLNAWVSASLANALERQGKYREAWAAIEPHIPVYSANVLLYAASILQRLGRVDEANDLGMQAVERYPGAQARADVAAILWREGKFAEAAALLDPKKAAYSEQEARWYVPENFLETFKNARPETAVAAYSALVAAGLKYSIIDDIAEKALKEHHADLAFALAEHLTTEPSRAPAANHPESFTALLIGYRALKVQKGADAAMAWLQPRIPSAVAMQGVLVFYQTEEYDLVQRFASTVPQESKTPEVATLEAASLLALKVPQSNARWEKLDEKIRALPEKTDLPPMAKYLAGVMDEQSFSAAARPREVHPEAEYFAGVKSMAAQNYQRALPMMIAASFGPRDNPPAAWAFGQLFRWNNQHAPWQAISEKG